MGLDSVLVINYYDTFSDFPTIVENDKPFAMDKSTGKLYFFNKSGVPAVWTEFGTGAEPTLPAGLIFAYAGSSIPTGWLDCNGAAVSRTTYADLFSAISTTWGAGDGSTTFNLPDLRSATLRGVGTPTLYTSNTVVALAQTIDDKFQGHWHNFKSADMSFRIGSNTYNTCSDYNPAVSSTYTNKVTGAITDGTNGTPRVGLETTGKARGVYYIIKF